MKKKFFAAFLLAFLLALSAAPMAWATDEEIPTSGISGSIMWEVDSNGVLTIYKAEGSLTGEIPDYAGLSAQPWAEYQDNIVKIDIKDGVTSIGRFAFSSCKNATEVVIANTVEKIDHQAFSQTSITSIDIPSNVKSIHNTAFQSANELVNINVDEQNTFYSDIDGVLFNKNQTELLKYPVGKTATTYAIPNGVLSITGTSFNSNQSLETIILPASLNKIEEGAFLACRNLSTFSIDSANNNFCLIDGVLFSKDKTELICYPVPKTDTSYTVPNEVKTIYTSAFAHTKLTNIMVPANVTKIGSNAFMVCNNLVTINIAGNIDTIPSYCFQNSRYLETVYIPASVKTIKIGAFNNNVNLKDIYFAGSESQWNAITIETSNDALDNATIHFGSNETPIVAVTGVSLNETALNLEINTSAKLAATVAPINATNKSVRWSSNNTSVATVDSNGTVTAVAPGATTITVTTEDGSKTAACTVTVTEKKIPVTSITLDKTTLSLEVKTSAQLNATVLPADTTSQIAWSSSDEKVAAVDSTGKITPLTKGTATITAAADGIKAECALTVTADTVYTISFDTDGGTLATGVTNPDYVIKGEAYTMPTASKSRYTLTAWAVGDKDSDNTVKANEVYTFTEDTTVYAVWQYNGGGGGSSSRPSGSTSGTTGTTKPSETEKPGTTTPGTSESQTITAANINRVFADVKSDAWYANAIAYVYNKGMMNGTDNGRFEPAAATTRAMLVTMLHRLEGEPATVWVTYNDVPSDQWFSVAVAWATNQGVVNGYENNLFGPNDALTREQLAAILYRYAQAKGYDVSATGSLSSFSDSSSVSAWAAEAMQWAVGAGIINGDNGALNPTGNATRAEVATMLMRFCEHIAK